MKGFGENKNSKKRDIIFSKSNYNYVNDQLALASNFFKTGNILLAEKIYSQLLKKNRIPHTVLNAKNHEREADIIANDSFRCVLIGYDYDYLDIAPSSATYRTQFYQDAAADTSRDPKLVITEQENSVFFGANF